MITIYDNIISKEEQEQIKKTLLSTNFPWFFIEDVTNIKMGLQKRPCFKHICVYQGKQNSQFINLFEPIISATNKKLKYEKLNIFEIRSFLQLPLNKNILKDNKLDTPHLDQMCKHLVFLYYVCDSDGETVIFDYKSKDHQKDIPYFDDLKELKRIKPKQGRVVVFDGSYWHTAAQPQKNVRCIVNINVIPINEDYNI